MSSSQSQSKKTMTWATIVSIPKTTVDNAKKIPNRLENILVDMALEKKKKIEQAKQAKQAKQIILQRQRETKEKPEQKPEPDPKYIWAIPERISEATSVGHNEVKGFFRETTEGSFVGECIETLCQKEKEPARKPMTKSQLRKYQIEKMKQQREEDNARCWEEIERLHIIAHRK
jgi:hypothetical protein